MAPVKTTTATMPSAKAFPTNDDSSSSEDSPKGSGALSVTFPAPMGERARSERISQMAMKHPAFEQARKVQEVLFGAQKTLRRMPGVPGSEAEAVAAQLKDVSRIVNQETAQLVDALMNLTLDAEENNKTIARMSLDSSLTKATVDEQARTIQRCEDRQADEARRRTALEDELAAATEVLYGGNWSKIQERIHHLEGQLNERRSQWTLKFADNPRMVARALESMVVSFSDGTKLAAFREPLTKIVEGMRASAPPLRGGASDALEFGHQVPAAAGLSLSRPQTARPGAMPNGAGLPGPGSAHASPFSSRNSSTWSLAQSSRAPSRNGGYMTPGGSNGRAVSTGSNPQHRQQQAAGMSLSRPGTAFAPPRDYYQYHQAPPRRALKYEADNTNSEVTTTGPPIMLTERSVTAWSEQVAQFYAVIRGFVDRHAAEPMGAGPDKVRALVESGAWAVLARVYKPMHQGDAASYLEVHLREPCSKRCLVTRVIVDFVVNSVWVPAAWRGSGPQADRALAELQEELDRTKGLPGVDRQPALDRQAAVIDGIMGLHDITSVYAAWAGAAPPDPFHKAKLEGLAGTLLAQLGPLLNPFGSTPDAVYRDLAPVAEKAWDLSSKILTSRLTFDFRFPEIGSRFSMQCMVPVWPLNDPTELQAQHWRVSLVTTPVITCRNDTGGSITAYSVGQADVMCMQ